MTSDSQGTGPTGPGPALRPPPKGLGSDAGARSSADPAHQGGMNNGSLPAEQDHGTDDLVLQTISHLEELLTEKDQLVTALTVQLEEAAERIDRLQRQGNDRGARGGGIGSIPVEMLEEQRNIAENVERFVVQWEEAQPTAALARIEMQLIELRELVVSQSGGGSPSSETAPHAAQQSASSLAGWEAMKANLLQGNEPEEVVESAEPAEEDLEAEITIPPPNPVPPDADTRILHLAIEQRDAYIAALQQAMQRAELRHRKAAVLGGGDDVPESLQHRLAELEHIFQEQQRLAEVELSLERARLGREEMRLRHVDETLTRELKRLGVQSGKPAAERPTEEAGKNARWRRILGIVKPEGE